MAEILLVKERALALNGLLLAYLLMYLVNPLSHIAPHFIILLYLTPYNFTRQGESSGPLALDG
jgi:hypothetical protein